MQNRQTSEAEETGLSTFEQADPDARSVELEMPDILVFDTDSKRMGDYGGFFVAEDCGAANYNVTGAPSDPKSRERVNGPNNRIPGIHLPDKVHFALVAAGPLFTTKEEGDDGMKDVFHFEAIVFCREVIDRRTNGPALLKLTTKGPAAVKLYSYMKLDINKGEESPIQRLNAHYHALAKKLLDGQKITKERYEHIIRQEATAQMFWMPVEVRRGVQIGRSEKKSVIGCMVYTDEPEGGRSKKFKSRWPLVDAKLLTTQDAQGGLLMTGPVQKFAQENRARYETALQSRAAFKGQPQEQETEQAQGTIQAASSSERQSAPQQSSATRAIERSATPQPADEKATLLAEARKGLEAIGKKETDPDVIHRMEEYGSSRLDGMSPVQLSEFNTYIRSFADRRAATQKRASQQPPTQAA